MTMSSRLLCCVLSLLSVLVYVSGQCSTPPPSCSSGPSNVAVPNAWYSALFSSQITGTSYGYQASDPTDASCNVHSGMAVFTGGSSSTGTSYVDLNQASGANTAGSALPGFIGGSGTIGGVSSGTAGWTFEITFKANQTGSPNWAKVFAIGSAPYVNNLFMGFNGNSMEWDFGEYDPSGHEGLFPIIQSTPGLTLNVWYHVVIVLQQASSTSNFGNWWLYVNGNLTAYNMISDAAYQWYPTAVNRSIAYLARSDWSGDNLFQGLVDTFRIYNQALVQTQAQALYYQQMGGCSGAVSFGTGPITPSTIYPNGRSTATASVSPIYTANFNTDPRSAAGGSSAAQYGWIPTDPDDTTCGISTYHQGIVVLSGDYATGTLDALTPYINMSATSGAYAVNSTTAFPQVIGGPSGAGSVATYTSGWSFEITFKPALQETWSELFTFGQLRPSTATGNCLYDITFAYTSNTNNMRVTTCNANNFQDFIDPAVIGIQPGLWYHAVWSIQDLGNGNGQYYFWLNGQLSGTMSNAYYPPAVLRQNAMLGKSGYIADAYWSGEIDTFNLYNQAFSDAQVGALYTAAMGPSGTQVCSLTPSTTPLPPTPYYSQTFSIDPRLNPRVPNNNTGYSWVELNSTDSEATHTGLLVLSGCIPGGCVGGQYVDLTARGGPHSLGAAPLRPIGGMGTGSFATGTAGWSFEITFKPYSYQQWAKLFDIGDQSFTLEIVMGWLYTNSYFGVDVSDQNGVQTQPAATPTLYPGSWYHVVWVIQYSTTNSSAAGVELANYFVYTNGQLSLSVYGSFTNNAVTAIYPQYGNRTTAWLGKSDWGDANWQGEIDTFNIYSQALNPNQVATLYQAATQPNCMGAGYDMSSIGNQDYLWSGNSYNWAIHPCGQVMTSGYCTGSFCQGTTAISTYQPSQSPVYWQAIAGGVQMTIVDGAQCGGSAYGRTGIIKFLCSSASGAPELVSVNESPVCTYTAVITTILACNQPVSNLTSVIGEPFTSPVCGGGIYDLSSLNTADLKICNGNTCFAMRPCAAVTTTNCSSLSSGTSFCQYGGSLNTVANYASAIATGSTTPVVYSTTTTGLQLVIANGATCLNYYPRVGIFNLVCNATQTTPKLISVVENSAWVCHYTATIQTSAVCTAIGTATTTAPAITVVPGTTTSTQCGGAGFDLSSLMMDFAYNFSITTTTQYNYNIHPCGALTNPATCPSGTMFCQSTNSSIATWNPNTATWLALPIGVQMTIQDGTACAAIGGAPRQANIVFVCTPSATAPVLNYVYEQETCHYEAYISTAAACTQQLSLLNNAAVGSSFYSTTCGGGIFNLSPLVNYGDFIINTNPNALSNDTSGYLYYLAVCQPVSNANCQATSIGNDPSSFCQLARTSTPVPINIASYAPPTVTPIYTVTSTGLMMTIQDGTACSVISNAARTAIYNFVCSPTATTPMLASVNETEVCHYTATIYTSAVCRPFSSSSSTAAAGVSSSSGSNTVAPGQASSSSSSSSRTRSSSSSSTASITSAGPGLTSSTSTGQASITSGSSSTGTGAIAVVTSGKSGLTSGQLAGAIIGPIAAVFLCCIIFACIVARRRKQGWKKHETTQSGQAAQAGQQNPEAETEHTAETSHYEGEHPGHDVEMGTMDH